MASPPCKEQEVLIKHYANLTSTMRDVDNLLPHFVTARIINSDDMDEIKATPRAPERVARLLKFISGPLDAGLPNNFYKMLDIMYYHGNDSTKELAIAMWRKDEAQGPFLMPTHSPVQDWQCHPSSSSSSVYSPTANFESTQRKLFKGHTLAKLSGKCANVFTKIKSIIKGKGIKIEDLLFHLNIIDTDNSTIFSTDAASAITRIDELFTQIGKYCNVFNYDLLVSLLNAIECKEAIEILDDFTRELQHSVLMELDLLSEIGEPQNTMPGVHRLIIKYTGDNCKGKTERLIRNVICECFHLNTWSITFDCVQHGCFAFAYQISSAVKCHLLYYKTTADEYTLLKKYNIESIVIDDDVLTFQSTTKVYEDCQVVKSDTSESGSSEDEDEDSECSIKSRIEKIYSGLEGLTFKGTFEGPVEMGMHRSTERPTYIVTDRDANKVFGKIYRKMKGRQNVWKGINTRGNMYILYGTEKSVRNKGDGVYHIPIGGVEVIVSKTLVKYQAIVNITVE